MIAFRVTNAERKTIDSLASTYGMSTSDYVRARALATDSDPEVVAAAYNVTNHLSQLEGAVAEAQAVLRNKKGG